MSSPDPLQDYDEEEQRSQLLLEQAMDEEEKKQELIAALWMVERAGLKIEADILAYGCGLGTEWEKEKA